MRRGRPKPAARALTMGRDSLSKRLNRLAVTERREIVDIGCCDLWVARSGDTP